jgi:RHS repeat-associated protein
MTTHNSYDNVNRLAEKSSASSAQSVVNSQYAYNAASQRTRVTLQDGSYWVFGYDALGQVTNGTKFFADGTRYAGQQFGYAFDTIGNRTATQAGGDQNGANLRQASYASGLRNELTCRTVPGAVDVMGMTLATNTVKVNGSNAYQRMDYFREQITTNNTNAALWVAIQVTAPGQPTNSGSVFVAQTPEGLSYDADGDLTQDGRWVYAWDGEHRLFYMTSMYNAPLASQYVLNFQYDYMGRRIQKLLGNGGGPLSTNRFLYDGWNLVAVLDGWNNRLYSFNWGLDLSGSTQGAGGVGGLISMTVYSGTNAGTYFYCYDGNGNVVALLNAATGAITADYEYGPFRELIRATGPMAKVNPFMFSTKYYDWETGLSYYGYRYYNPSTGRWLSKDPMGEQQRAMNLYQFTANDCVNGIDILGLLAGVFKADDTAKLYPNGGGFSFLYDLSMDANLSYIQDVKVVITWKCLRQQVVVTTDGHQNWFVKVPGAGDVHGVNAQALWLQLIKKLPCCLSGSFSGSWSGSLYPAPITGSPGGGQTTSTSGCTTTGCNGGPPTAGPPIQLPTSPTAPPNPLPVVPSPQAGAISVTHSFSGTFDKSGVTSFAEPAIGVNYH